MTAKRVLFCHRLNLGDLVCASPALQWLRQRNPGDAFRLLTNDFCANIARMMPEFEHVYAYSKIKLNAPAEWRMLWKARRWMADRILGLCPSPDRRLAWRMRLLGSVAEPDFNDAPEHIAERLAWSFGWSGEEPLPPAKLRPPANPGVGQDVIIYVSARKPSNRPTVAQIIAIIELLRQRHPGIEVGVYGVPDAPKSAAHVPNMEVQLAMRSALAKIGLELRTPGQQEMFTTLAGCGSMIAPDCGLSHIAAGFGKAVVTMTGNIDPKVWWPYTPRTRSIQTASKQVADLDPADVVAEWELVLASPA